MGSGNRSWGVRSLTCLPLYSSKCTGLDRLARNLVPENNQKSGSRTLCRNLGPEMSQEPDQKATRNGTETFAQKTITRLNQKEHMQKPDRRENEQRRKQDVQNVGEYSVVGLWFNLNTELAPWCGANADDLPFNSPPVRLLRAIPLTILVRCLKPSDVTGQLRKFQGFSASVSLILGELSGLYRQPEPFLRELVLLGLALRPNWLNTHFLHSALPSLVTGEDVDRRIALVEVDNCLLFLTRQFDCHLAFTALQRLFVIH